MLKNERGSISLYALIAMLILITILLGMYIYNTQKHAQNLDVTNQIKTIYEKDVNNVNEIYYNMAGE